MFSFLVSGKLLARIKSIDFNSLGFKRGALRLGAFVTLSFLTPMLVGCVRTPVASDPLPAAVRELAARSSRPILLQVRAEPRITLGYQYMLLAVPFGRVVLENGAQQVADAAFVELSLHGFRPVDSSPQRLPALEIELVEADADAFDVLVLRRISTRVELRGLLRKADGQVLRACPGSLGRSRAWKAMAFAPQLNYVFKQAMERSVRQLLQCLYL